MVSPGAGDLPEETSPNKFPPGRTFRSGRRQNGQKLNSARSPDRNVQSRVHSPDRSLQSSGRNVQSARFSGWRGRLATERVGPSAPASPQEEEAGFPEWRGSPSGEEGRGSVNQVAEEASEYEDVIVGNFIVRAEPSARIQVSVKTLLSRLVTRKFNSPTNSPTNSLRMPYVRVEP
eukprot:1184795-Prorocentrum_minimum.AAC.2